jgi:xanthine dehydrogenase accessory factor
MKNIYETLLRELNHKEALCLATIIETKGSSPQFPGASALFSSGGLVAGTIGGGILEAKAEEAAIDALREGVSFLMPYSLSGEIISEEEAVCGGDVTVLIDIDVRDSLGAFERIRNSLNDRHPGVLATFIRSPDGELRQDSFQKGVFLKREWIEKSEIFGDDAGQKSSPYYEEIKNSFREGTPKLQTIRKNEFNDESQEVLLFLEPLFPQSHLVIVGAGHIGKALAHLGSRLDFEVTVLDDRAEFANAQNIPEADHVIVGEIPSSLKAIPATPDTYVVIVTRGHSHDSVALRECITSNAGYIGMIGSARKIHLMRQKFLEDGWATAEQFDRVYAPIGIEIQSKTVEEIAVSIAAQLVLVRNQLQNKGRTTL